MLIIDGVKYNLWVPQDELREFHPIVEEHSNEIFGQDTVYFNRSVKLRSLAGLGAKPEGFVIDLIRNEWYVVEVELSKHDAYDHIVNQLTRFINGIDNPRTRNEIVDALYDEINKNKVLRAYTEEKVKGDIHHWLSKLISQSPKMVVVIEEKTGKVVEACKILMKNFETYIIEFKTFMREDAPKVHAHLFEPLYKPEVKKVAEILEVQRKELPIISREELASLKDGMVVICPSKPEGVNFLLQYNAWGFVRIRKKPKYFALYVTRPESKISFFGEVEEILHPKDPSSPITEDEARRYKTFKEGKKVIVLKSESLRKLDKGIPKGTSKKKILQGIKYVTLNQFINAKTLDDL